MPPSNISAATATVLTMPLSTSQDVSGAAAPNYEVWFKYTAGPGEYMLHFFGSATGSTYQPVQSVFTGTPSALDDYLGGYGVVGKPLQLPLTPGSTYYFQIRNNVGGAIDSLLYLNGEIAPNEGTSVWSIAIPDDTAGFPMVIYNADGSVAQTRPFPAGETGHVLPDGTSLWQDVATGTVVLYNGALVYQSSPVWVFSGVPPISSNRDDTFYVGDKGGGGAPARITTIGRDGTLGAVVWTLPFAGLTALAISNDETIAYLTGQVSPAQAIQRWSFATSAFLTPLAAAVSGYTVMNPILVLTDDTIIVGYYRSSPLDSFCRRYAPAGTILHTYAFGAVKLDHITHNTVDTSFWVWLHLAGASSGISRFQQLRVSDGVVLTTFDAPQYEGGVYQGTLPAPAPFGHSFSCPFTLVPPLPPYSPPSGPSGPGITPPHVAPSYHLDARYIRRLRRAPHVNQENVRVFYRKFELDLERGQGLPSGQGEDPLVLLRLSRDGGQTWGEEMRMSAGKLGAYTTRALARRLGYARDLVVEVVVSDPVSWSLVQAWMDLEPGAH